MCRLVDLVGFEPTTSSMPWKRAPNCATGPSMGGYVHENSTSDCGVFRVRSLVTKLRISSANLLTDASIGVKIRRLTNPALPRSCTSRAGIRL
jgi:hypothetical protein